MYHFLQELVWYYNISEAVKFNFKCGESVQIHFGTCIYTTYPIKSAVFMALPQKHLLALAGWVSCTQPPDRISSADAAAHPSAPPCCIKSPPKGKIGQQQWKNKCYRNYDIWGEKNTTYQFNFIKWGITIQHHPGLSFWAVPSLSVASLSQPPDCSPQDRWCWTPALTPASPPVQ